MPYYAKVVEGLVTKVIVCDAAFLDKYVDDGAGIWLETFIDGKTRGNYAGIGYTYDAINNAFYAQPPYKGWLLLNWKWTPPMPYPADNKMHVWDETSKTWAANTVNIEV